VNLHDSVLAWVCGSSSTFMVMLMFKFVVDFQPLQLFKFVVDLQHSRQCACSSLWYIFHMHNNFLHKLRFLTFIYYFSQDDVVVTSSSLHFIALSTLLLHHLIYVVVASSMLLLRHLVYVNVVLWSSL
jgi:hypothetical protein